MTFTNTIEQIEGSLKDAFLISKPNPDTVLAEGARLTAVLHKQRLKLLAARDELLQR